MTEVAEYLMANYYSHYTGSRPDIVPTPEVLEQGLANHPDKVLVIRDDKIRGVAVYVTLSDETYQHLQDMDINRADILVTLLAEHGPNVHVLMFAADGLTTLLMARKEIKRRLNPKTISWWDPTITKLNRFKIRR